MSEDKREQLLQISGQDLDGPPPLGPRVTYHIKCHGRDCKGNEVLDLPVPAEITISQCNMRSVITSEVNCQHIAGSHHYRCMASHQNEEDHDRHGHKIDCPYVMSMGHVEGQWKEPRGVLRNY